MKKFLKGLLLRRGKPIVIVLISIYGHEWKTDDYHILIVIKEKERKK
uniref:Uncharacterized protein n=2 Tax=unclassified Rosemountvirus TaxID=2738372 RepID=A0AAU8GJQ7_9CAUD